MLDEKLYFCTSDGVYFLDGAKSRRICCKGYSVYDLAFSGEGLLVCSNSRGLIFVNENGSENTLIGDGCWRIFKLSEKSFLVALDGPKIYRVDLDGDKISTTEIADLRGMANRYNWWFPHGLPHLTDFTAFENKLVASVEVGGVISANQDSLDRWILEGLKGVDAHNILKVKDSVLVAAASGIYKSENLKNWRKTKGSGGYNHAIETCGNLLLSHRMNKKPLILSEDLGENWVELDFKLDAPTFGQTCIKCLNEDTLLYAPSKIYIVKINEQKVVEQKLKLPNVYRIIK